MFAAWMVVILLLPSSECVAEGAAWAKCATSISGSACPALNKVSLRVLCLFLEDIF
ncbi:hypothetical protein M758_UG093300 [Ceratodon purpureus]|nr:hypothetical protein M758_UG092700 [Ceratodon purpureus]KAG0594611.1 hypothetical protein M758_UG092900 [Ceratodon purpureus]KAG0594615.1 hypothetical protein M758_UG093300 [Ceratodon purpureus]